MSERPWYKRYPSDFIAGTIALTAEEKGVYSCLLDLMYDRRRAITDDARELGRICGCSTRRFKQVRDRLHALGKLILRDGLISNARFEKQNNSEKIEAEKLRENGIKGAAKTNEKRSAANENNHLELEGPPSVKPAYQKPDTRNQNNKDFELWWQAYPKHVAKGAAQKSYLAIINRREASNDDLLRGAQSYANAVRGKDQQFTAHPATWLNGKRWLDQEQRNTASKPFSSVSDKDRWRLMLDQHHKGNWVSAWGPPLGFGGCEIPDWFIKEDATTRAQQNRNDQPEELSLPLSGSAEMRSAGIPQKGP